MSIDPNINITPQRCGTGEQRVSPVVHASSVTGVRSLRFAGRSRPTAHSSDHQQRGHRARRPDERRAEGHLRHQFAALALTEPLLASGLTDDWHTLAQRGALALDNGKECGEVPKQTDVADAAYALLALGDGIAARLLADDGPAQRTRAEAVIRAQVTSACPGRCRRPAPDGGRITA